MKKEKLLKILLVTIMAITLFAMATKTFAATDDDFYLNITNTVNDTNTNTNTNTNATNTTPVNNTSVNNTSVTNTTGNTNSNTNYNTNLPNTGIAENTMLGVALTILTIIAIYAYKKVKYYKNI